MAEQTLKIPSKKGGWIAAGLMATATAATEAYLIKNNATAGQKAVVAGIGGVTIAALLGVNHTARKLTLEESYARSEQRIAEVNRKRDMRLAAERGIHNALVAEPQP